MIILAVIIGLILGAAITLLTVAPGAVALVATEARDKVSQLEKGE